MRASVLADRKRSKRFLAGGWIDKGSRGRGKDGHARHAGRTTLLFLIRLRRVMAAILDLRVHLHRRAATRFYHLRRHGPRRNDRDGDRRRGHQANQKSQGRSHEDNNIGFRDQFNSALVLPCQAGETAEDRTLMEVRFQGIWNWQL